MAICSNVYMANGFDQTNVFDQTTAFNLIKLLMGMGHFILIELCIGRNFIPVEFINKFLGFI